MKRKTILFLLIAQFFLSCGKQEEMPTYTITGKILNEIDPRIFGAFFEKANWGGEIGCDAAISLKTRKVFPEVKSFMEWMNIPIVRFPGGTATDYYPWYYLIDNMPGKHQKRPANRYYRNLSDQTKDSSDGRMGLHEYIGLCKELNMEPLLVANLGDAFYEKMPVEKAAQELGADFVSYCNATTGKWAELRAKNGSPEPFGVKYFQIGNESWLFDGFKKNQRTPEGQLHYTNCVEAYIRAMKVADPSIQIIIDGVDGIGDEVMKRCGNLVAFNTFHTYSPWGISEIRRGTVAVPSDSVSPGEVWQSLASAPAIDTLTGLSVINNRELKHIQTPLAITEWNLNCWFEGKAKGAKPDNELLAYGIGAASYLHAIMRVSGKVKIANQSMLLGTSWKITGIRVDTTEQKRPTMYPTALVTGLYSRNHGTQFMEVKPENTIFYSQPLTLSGIKPCPKVAEQDVVVSADQFNFYVHVVNRSFQNTRKIVVLFPEEIKSGYTQFLLSDQTSGTMSEYANVEEIALEGASAKTSLTIPAKSVSVFKFSRK